MIVCTSGGRPLARPHFMACALVGLAEGLCSLYAVVRPSCPGPSPFLWALPCPVGIGVLALRPPCPAFSSRSSVFASRLASALPALAAPLRLGPRLGGTAGTSVCAGLFGVPPCRPPPGARPSCRRAFAGRWRGRACPPAVGARRPAGLPPSVCAGGRARGVRGLVWPSVGGLRGPRRVSAGTGLAAPGPARAAPCGVGPRGAGG
ncbi:hypothetical protein KI387_021087, partial [Taxus chinensis]